MWGYFIAYFRLCCFALTRIFQCYLCLAHLLKSNHVGHNVCFVTRALLFLVYLLLKFSNLLVEISFSILQLCDCSTILLSIRLKPKCSASICTVSALELAVIWLSLHYSATIAFLAKSVLTRLA